MGLLGRLIPSMMQNVKLVDLDVYVDDETSAYAFAELLVDSLADVLASEGRVLLSEFLGIKNTTSPLGGIILKFLATALGEALSDSEKSVEIKQAVADVLTNFDVGDVIDMIKKRVGNTSDIVISILQDVTGIGED